MKQFPNDQKYLKIIKNLHNLDFFEGNCGIFAIMLHKFYKVGCFVAFNDGCGGFYHVLFKYNNKYYDAFGIYNKDEMILKYGQDKEFLDDFVDLTEMDIKENTSHHVSIKKILKYWKVLDK